MKLNEKKENLPIDFLTSFISRGWEDISTLKASIDGIKQEFNGATAAADILQDLLDAQLICVGRLEKLMNDKKFLEIPTEEDLKEAFDINGTEDEEEFIPREEKVKVETELPDYEVEIEQKGDKIEIELEPKEEEVEPKIEKSLEDKKDLGSEPFDYYVDFEEPELSDDEPSPRELWLNR